MSLAAANCGGYLLNSAPVGSFGVDGGRYDKRTGRTVAIKIIDLESAEDEIEDIQQEIQILSQLDSPHVTKCVVLRQQSPPPKY